MQKIKPTTETKELYSDRVTISKHPAFGLFRVARINGTQHLFGSEVLPSGYIEIEVKPGEEWWRLSGKTYHASTSAPIMRVAMSYAQFAEAITNQNCGEGIPCTIEVANNQRVPAILENTLSVSDQIKLDLNEQSKSINDALKDLYAQIEGLKISKKDKEELKGKADKIGRELNSNLPFIVEQCEEAVEHITTKGKIEVEAFAQSRIHQLGMEALAYKQLKLK